MNTDTIVKQIKDIRIILKDLKFTTIKIFNYNFGYCSHSVI